MKIGIKPFIFILLCSSFFENAFSQDFTDTRRKTESFVRLQPPEIRADVASFAFKGISESAQAPKLRKIEATVANPNDIVFKGDTIYAEVKIVPFDAAKHKFTYDDDDKTVIRIDRRTYYGNYGKMPSTSIGSVRMVIGGDTISVPPLAYQDLHNMRFTYIDKGAERTRDALYVSKDGRKIYLYLLCIDNTGSYEVTWIFWDKKYYRRVLDYGFL